MMHLFLMSNKKATKKRKEKVTQQITLHIWPLHLVMSKIKTKNNIHNTKTKQNMYIAKTKQKHIYKKNKTKRQTTTTHMYIHIHTYIHTYIHAYIYISKKKTKNNNTHVYTYTYIYYNISKTCAGPFPAASWKGRQRSACAPSSWQ